MGGLTELTVPFAGTVLRVDVSPGDQVRAGTVLVVLESMKMEHVMESAAPGTVRAVAVSEGDAVQAGDVLLLIDEDDAAIAPLADDAGAPDSVVAEEAVEVRPELAELRSRVDARLDDGRPEATERRHAGGRRTARENIEDLCDPDSFEEYGGLVIAAQRARRSTEDLVANTPADGLVAGIGRVNGDLFDNERSRCAVLSYDYSVLAGTQGQMNHRKKDRLFELVERLRLPVVLFAEGGGGRPGDTDMAVVTGLDTEAFALFGALSGKVPLVGVVSGRCFAGNAALLGCCHVIIATPDANIGMGGPAMIEGGGLGRVPPGGDRAGVGAGAERGRRCPLRRREGGRRGGPPLPGLLPGRRAGVDGAGPGPRCATSSRPTGAGSTTCGGRSSCWPTRARSSSCGRRSPRAWSRRWPGSRAGRSG